VNVRARLRGLRDDAGFTLIELMVSTLMFAILSGAAFTALDVGTKAERGQQARHDAMVEIRGAMDQFTKDLRQATYIDPTSTHTRITMKTLLSGVESDVTYELVESPPGSGTFDLKRVLAGGAVQMIIRNMVVGTTPLGTPDPPICYSYYSAGAPSTCIDTGHPPDALTAIRLTFAKDPEFNPGEPITLATDVQLRNL
jgi:prepilin-type N-terminal cleavage/methylation domain-containing protein